MKSIYVFSVVFIWTFIFFSWVGCQHNSSELYSVSFESSKEYDINSVIENSSEGSGESNSSEEKENITTSERPLVVEINEQLAKEEKILESLHKESNVEEVDIVKERALHNLIRIFGLSESRLRKKPTSTPPEFMVDLYNTITDSYGVTRSKNPYDAHVVRSFMEWDHSSADFFYFNITGLEANERVLEAELHVHRLTMMFQKLHPSLMRTPFYVLSLYQVLDPKHLSIPDLHLLMGVHYVPAFTSGWEIFNVTQAVSEWIKDNSTNHGFLLAATTVSGSRIPVSYARKGHKKQPILVLFNEDSSLDQFNEIPISTPRLPSQTYLRESIELNEKEIASNNFENPKFHHALLYEDSSTDHPNFVTRLRSRRSKNITELIESSTSAPTNVSECSRHDLFVSFESIGWSSWIISPKSYNAYYCSGTCLFPLGQEVKPTNHATVQSIIHQLQLSPGVNRPCCVPSNLLPISLLYYDDNDNVVLKQYVDMVAHSCGCQ